MFSKKSKCKAGISSETSGTCRPISFFFFFSFPTLSHSQFGKCQLLEQQVSLTWSSSRENRLHSCLARTHTCTHKQGEERERKKKRQLMKDSKHLLYSGELWVLVGQPWQGDAPAVSFVCASGPNKSLVRNLWEARAVGKECPPLSCGLVPES